MGQLFRRISRLAKAELNHINGIDSNFTEATAFAAAGGVAGASIGKIGILAKGTGFSVGAIPLSAAGALTGVALYEAIRAVAEGDASSAGAAAVGAAAGAGVSAAIGGVGVAAGGTAFAVGMAPMVAAGAVAGLGIAGLSRLLQQVNAPEKLLNLAIDDMHEELAKMRQAVITVVAAQKLSRQKYEQAQAEVNKWQRRTQLALQKGDENLARQALERKKSFAENADTLKLYVDKQTLLIDNLKGNLIAFENKVCEAKAFKARIIAVMEDQEQLHVMVRGKHTSSATAAFERMEEKVLMQEARAQAVAELASEDKISQFEALISVSDIDDELAALKAQMSSKHAPSNQPNYYNQPQLPNKHEVVDAEVEVLRKQLDQI